MKKKVTIVSVSEDIVTLLTYYNETVKLRIKDFDKLQQLKEWANSEETVEATVEYLDDGTILFERV